MLEAAQVEQDAAARLALVRRAQRRVARRLPYAFLWWPRNVVVATRRLEGFAPDPSGELVGLARARLRGGAAE
jgi:ABC-type transport system substrate-binding protein